MKVGGGRHPSDARAAGGTISARGPLAQLVEQGTFNPKVTGSIPVRPTNPRAPSLADAQAIFSLWCRCRYARAFCLLPQPVIEHQWPEAFLE
jgi:hypothetical protein